ncbi:hypothetical protein SAMN05421663_105280 [Terribacillus halophilus]|uniref:Uncharacterized protein n=1 Tax=Terribacillus halophilus TaxID=361279 RepID=A0A1G6QYR3_9BACI|nr:hypothetical protein [Terribacillus halophilus]SDC97472.1 hypothetical protein SAMN05421663_105280 [Terribacillus halophilus]
MKNKLLQWWISIPRYIRVGSLGLLTIFLLTAAFIKGLQVLLHTSELDYKQVIIGLIFAIALTAGFRLKKK